MLPVLLPLAIVYQRKASAEAAASNGAHQWPPSLLHRPVVLYLATWGTLITVTVLLTVVLSAFGVRPV